MSVQNLITHIIAVSDLDGSNCEVVTSANGHIEYKEKFLEVHDSIIQSGCSKDIHVYTRSNKTRVATGRIHHVTAEDQIASTTASLRAELRELEPADLHKIALAEGIDPTGLTDGEIINAIVASTDSAPKDAA